MIYNELALLEQIQDLMSSGTFNVHGTILDGANYAQGFTTDDAKIDPEAGATVISLLKGLLKQLQGTGTGSQPVLLSSNYPVGAVPFSITQDSTNNASQLLKVSTTMGSIPEDKSVYISAVEVIIFGAATEVDMRVLLQQDPSGVPVNKWKEVVGAGSPSGSRVGITFPIPIKFEAGKDAGIAVDAVGVSGGFSTANMAGYIL